MYDETEPEPPLYAAQYRNMHTAIHHFILFEDEDHAEAALDYIIKNQLYPDWLTRRPSFVEDIEIHWMRPPTEYKGRPVVVVNGDHKPDCYT